MRDEKIEKQLDHALDGAEAEDLNLKQVKAFWRSKTHLPWDFAGDNFDTLALPALKLKGETRRQFLNLIHQAVVDSRRSGLKTGHLSWLWRLTRKP